MLMSVTKVFLNVINIVIILLEAISVPVLKAMILMKITTLALVCKEHCVRW